MDEEWLSEVDTVNLNNFVADLQLHVYPDSTTDIVLVNTDTIRLSLAAQYQLNTVYLDVFIHLPEVNGFKNLAVAYTGEGIGFNGTSLTLKVMDSTLEIGQFNNWDQPNFFRPFVHFADEWFVIGGPNVD